MSLQSLSCVTFSQPDKLIKLLIDDQQIPIKKGYGEYVVFLKGCDRKKLSAPMFAKVYSVLSRYSPARIMYTNNENSQKVKEEYADRYELISKNIKLIDQDLEVAFIPRTLYELVLIRKCIKEDLKRGEICKFLNPQKHSKAHIERKTNRLKKEIEDQQKEITALEQELLKLDPNNTRLKAFLEQDIQNLQKEKLECEHNYKRFLDKPKSPDPKCWHRICSKTPELLPDTLDENILNIAFRLNKAILKTCDSRKAPFTYESLAGIAEKEIAFLKDCYLDAQKGSEKVFNCKSPGPAMCFRYESVRGSTNPMGLRDEKDAVPIRIAIALECSLLAHNSLFFYRGAEYAIDVPHHRTNPKTPFSLSYGTSLFSGVMFDQKATAFAPMRNGTDGFVIPVPIYEISASPFYYPISDTMYQIYGIGEIFHGRSKGWKGISLEHGMQGVAPGPCITLDHLHSDLSEDDFNRVFDQYKKGAILLTQHSNK